MCHFVPKSVVKTMQMVESPRSRQGGGKLRESVVAF